MIIGHSRPSGTTWGTSTSGTTAYTARAGLVDDRPDTTERFTWPSGTQNTSVFLRLRGIWPTAFVPGLVGLSNVSLPAGTKVIARFRRADDPAATGAGGFPYAPMMYADTQRIIEGPRGDRSVWFVVQPGAEQVVGVEFQIYNDVDGSATIVAESTFTVGEAVACPVFNIDISDKPSIDNIDPTVATFSGSGMPYVAPGVPYRQLNFRFINDNQTTYFGGQIPQVMAKIDRGQSCVYVLRWRDPSGALSPELLHATALIGVATKLPTFQHEAGPLFSSGQVVVRESPIPV